MDIKDTQGLLFPKTGTKKKRMQHPKSILPTRKGTCFICKRKGYTEEHHIFGGKNRKHSEKYGLKVDLCPACHRTGGHAAQRGGMVQACLHEIGQHAFESQAGSREQFIKIFGKSYF